MDAARVLAVERRLRKSLLQNLKRNGHEPPPPTRNTTWAVVGVIPVGNPRAQPVARARANPGASTTKHSVDTRPVEEMVTNEAWDDAGAVDTVSDNTYHASASTNSMPAPAPVPVTTPATGTGATDIMGDFVGWLRDDDVGPMVFEELGAGGGMLGGRGCARLACTCHAAQLTLKERNKAAEKICLPEGLDSWLASCLEKRQQVRLLEEHTAFDTRELNPRGTVLHGCILASARPFGPYHVDEFDSAIVVGCPANATDDFRIG